MNTYEPSFRTMSFLFAVLGATTLGTTACGQSNASMFRSTPSSAADGTAPQEKRPEQSDGSLGAPSAGRFTWFEGSLTPCTKELVDQGVCTKEKNPLVQCVAVQAPASSTGTCVVSATVSLREKSTQFSKQVTDKSSFATRGQRQYVCFDFSKDEYNLWAFDRFERIRGTCSADAAPVSCSAESDSCAELQAEASSCSIGWPCMHVRVQKSSYSPCTPELEGKGLCKLAQSQSAACFTYENSGSANLICDLRLVSSFSNSKASSILRQEKLFYGQKHTLCFPYDRKHAEFESVRSMSIVCQPMQSGANPTDACDVGASLCENETRKILTVNP